MAFPTGWERKCAITIDASEVDGTLTDFPFLLTEDNLPSEMFDADGSFPAQSGGGDIRVSSDSAGATQLPLEVVQFVTDNDPANGTAELWTKVPTVSSSVDTTIYIWYNTAGSDTQPGVTTTYGRDNVWDSNHLGVYHAEDESSSDTCVDSTGNGNTGTVDADDGPQQGPFGSTTGSWGLDGSFDDVPTGSGNIVDNLTANTIELWLYAIADEDKFYSANGDPFSAKTDATGFYGSASNVFQIQMKNDTTGTNFYETSANSFSASTWTHFAITWASGETPTVYIDGAADTLSHSDGAATGAIDAAAAFLWGNAGNTTLDGRIDEGRVSDSKRSAAWIAANYSNQNAAGTFASAGTPEDAAGAISISAQSATHTHAAAAPSLTQTHAISAANAAQAHAAAPPVISQTHIVSVDASAHAHAAADVTLAVAVAISAANAAHTQTATAPSVTQTHSLTVDAAAHTHAAAATAISQTHVVSAAASAHSHAAAAPAVTQTHVVTVSSANHAHAAAEATITVGIVAITAENADHGHAAAAPAITQTHSLTVAAAAHGQAAAAPAITQTHVLIVSGALHGHTAANVSLVLPAAVTLGYVATTSELAALCMTTATLAAKVIAVSDQTSYDVGDLARITGAFTTPAGVAHDPTTVNFSYVDPGGTVTTLVYLTDAELVRDSLGNFHVDINVNAAGRWSWRWYSTGNGQAAERGTFIANPAEAT